MIIRSLTFLLLLILPGFLKAQAVFELVEMTKFKNVYSNKGLTPEIGSIKFLKQGSDFTYIWIKDKSGKTVVNGMLKRKTQGTDAKDEEDSYELWVPTGNQGHEYQWNVSDVKINVVYQYMDENSKQVYKSFKFDKFSKTKNLDFSFTLDGDVNKIEYLDEINFTE